MSGLEIFGAVATALGMVNGITVWFGTRRNSPRQVQRLERMLNDLNDARLINKASAQERQEIKRLISECTVLLRAQSSEGKDKAGRLWRFFFAAEAEAKLRIINDEISEELSRLEARVHAYGSSHASPEIHPLPSIPEGPMPTRRDTADTEATYYLPISPVLAPRRPSIGQQQVPCKLTIQDANGNCVIGPLKLETLTLIEQDDDARLIQYESKDKVARITHRVPRGRNIRYEDDEIEDREVLFLDEHDITVEDAEGYKVYQLQPKYQFKTVELREEFLIRVRQRDLLGRFYVEEITCGRDLVAQTTVIRFWNKKGDARGPTMSFLGRDAVLHEWALVDFDKVPNLPQPNVVELVDKSNKKTDFKFKAPKSPSTPREERRRSFTSWRRKSSTSSTGMAHSRRPTGEDLPPAEALEEVLHKETLAPSDAQAFRTLFEDNHPLAIPVSPPIRAFGKDSFQSPFLNLPGPSMDQSGSTTSGSAVASSSTSIASGSLRPWSHQSDE